MRSRPIIMGFGHPPKEYVRFSTMVIVATALLLLQNADLVRSYQCYQCVYTNVTRYLEKGLPINNAPAGKQMVPVAACSDTNTTITSSESEYVEINKDCPYGCATIVVEFGGKKIVNRGCVPQPYLCGNYTVGETSQSCCKGDLCNGGAYTKPQGGPYSCYQCVGSTSTTLRRSMNVYANKFMTVTKDCLDDSFDPQSSHVEELNHGCSGGCLSATVVPLDNSKDRIVMRGCASPTGFPCMSMELNRDVLQVIAGMDKYKSMAQKCCNSPFCNAGSAVNFVTYNSSSFDPKYNVHKLDKTDNTIKTHPETGSSRSMFGSSAPLFQRNLMVTSCILSILTFLMSVAVS